MESVDWEPRGGSPFNTPARAIQVLVRHCARFPFMMAVHARTEGNTGISLVLPSPPVDTWGTWAPALLSAMAGAADDQEHAASCVLRSAATEI